MNDKLVLVVLALLATATAPAGVSQETLTVPFTADAHETFPFAESEFAIACSVTVPTGSFASAVLDQAVADGCISSWGYRQFAFGRFVTEVNGTHGCNTHIEPLTPLGLSWVGALAVWSWWEFQINGVGAPVGIDDYEVQPGDEIGFLYRVELSLLGPFPADPTGLLPGVVPCAFQ